MTGHRIPLGIVVGSTREGRFGGNIAGWLADGARILADFCDRTWTRPRETGHADCR